MARKVKPDPLALPESLRTLAPPCPYFGQCGGCRYQDVDYRDQVRWKAAWLSELFGRAVEVTPSPVIYGYRNRMDFVYAFGKLGLRKPGSHKWVVDIEHCALMNEKANVLLKKVRALLGEYQIQPYNYINHQGYLRYAVIRSTSLGETMVNLVTRNDTEDVIPILDALKDQADSVIWSIQGGMADHSYGNVHQVTGAPIIHERIGKYRFKLGPNTFFQNNPYLLGTLIEDFSEWVSGRTLDLYCGVGCLGISVTDYSRSVLGVDSVKDSIALATENAQLNQVQSIRFECESVEDWIRTYKEKAESLDTVIADPPREGLTPKVIPCLLQLRPNHLIYISCNPKALRQDLETLSDYELISLKGYDLFPQTPHVEAVAVMRRK